MSKILSILVIFNLFAISYDKALNIILHRFIAIYFMLLASF